MAKRVARPGLYEKSSLTTDVQVRGLADVMKRLAELGPDIEEQIFKKQMRRSLKTIKDEAKRLVPVGDTGNLAKGISVRIKKDKFTKEVRGQVISRAPHAHLIEFGHRMMGHKPNKTESKTTPFVPAHSYMRPALISKGEEVLAALAEGVTAAMDKLEAKGKR